MKKIICSTFLILSAFLAYSQTAISKEKISLCNKNSDTISVHLFDSCKELMDSDGRIVKSFNVELVKDGDIISNKQMGSKIDVNTLTSIRKLKPNRIFLTEIIFVQNKAETKMDGGIIYYLKY